MGKQKKKSERRTKHCHIYDNEVEHSSLYLRKTEKVQTEE
jgi:hypothetical protein